MEEANIDSVSQGLVVVRREERTPIVSTRDLLASAFRHKSLLFTCFLGILMLAVLASILVSRKYESEAKILVKHERADPLLTPGAEPIQAREDGTSAEEMNSEVELIRSEDLLRSVVLRSGLARSARDEREQARNVAQAFASLRERLKVEVLHKTNIISVRYASRSPDLSTRVVDAVVGAYFEKHAAVHSSSGLDFFDQQVAKYSEDLKKAEATLSEFSQRRGGAVSPEAQREALLQKQSEFKALLQQTRSQVSETVARIQTLEKEADAAPRRVTTQERKLDNPQLLQDLKASLLKLDLRRTELSTKYKDSYPPVQELDQEIARTQAAISSAEGSPLRDQTTDVNPIRQWIDSELAKTRAELRSLQSKAETFSSIVADYERQARAMDEQALQYGDLLRNAKSSEENYLLYSRKREEARITNTLDQRRISNVKVIQPATRPLFPVRSPVYYLVVGFMLAFVVSVGLLVTLEHVDNTFRTPYQVERLIQVPVLATLPLEQTPVGKTDTELHLPQGME